MEGVSQHPNIKPKFDLTGFNKMIREDENLQDVLEVLNLNYGDITQLSPEKKIVLLTFSSAIKCASVNKMLNALKAQSASTETTVSHNSIQPEGQDKNVSAVGAFAVHRTGPTTQPQSLNIEKNTISSNTNNSNKQEKKINNDIISFDDNNDNNNE
jgi:hypothetical protein